MGDFLNKYSERVQLTEAVAEACVRYKDPSRDGERIFSKFIYYRSRDIQLTDRVLELIAGTWGATSGDYSRKAGRRSSSPKGSCKLSLGIAISTSSTHRN